MSDRNQIKKLRQKYLDVLRLEEQAAAGAQLNAEQTAKLGRKAEFADKLAALGCEAPELQQPGGPAAAGAAAYREEEADFGGAAFGAGGELRVRPSTDGLFATAIPNADFVGAITGARAFQPSKYRAVGPEQVAAAQEAAQGKVFVVKVQVPLGASAASMPMMFYDQPRAFQCHVFEDSSEDARRLGQLIRARGVRGQKAYMYARAEGEELVLSDALLPVQPW